MWCSCMRSCLEPPTNLTEVQVAKLAGLPAPVVARAKHLLAEFEAADRLSHSDRLVADLPLFSASLTASPILTAAPSEGAAAPQMDVLGEALDALDPDELSPRDAMDALYRLKQLRRTKRD